MALSFSEKLRGTQMGKAFRLYEVTHDGSVTTIEASDMDLNYFDYAIANGLTALSAVADYEFLGTRTGKYIVFNGALSASTVCVVQAWGW